jgi:hypothetical protein
MFSGVAFARARRLGENEHLTHLNELRARPLIVVGRAFFYSSSLFRNRIQKVILIFSDSKI